MMKRTKKDSDLQVLMANREKLEREEKAWQEFLDGDDDVITFDKVATPFVKQFCRCVVEAKAGCGHVLFDAIDRVIDIHTNTAWCVLLTKEYKEKYKIVKLEKKDAVPVVYIF